MKKVCIISVSLGKGGLERSCANLSQLLSDNGYDVHLVILNDDVDYDYSGELFNLGKYKTEDDTLLKRFVRFRKLRAYFRKQKFDYVIENRIGSQPWRELYYMFYIYGLGQKVVYMQHSGRLGNHMPDPSLITRCLVAYASAFIGVSKGITSSFNEEYNTLKCRTIYNFRQELKEGELKSDLPSKYILYLGRLDDATKNFTLMFESYKSALSASDCQLLIMGEGPDKALLISKVKELGLKDKVVFASYSSDIFSPLKQAKFLVLTSRYEGFPMVLVEALSVGTPVVSVDCHSGPSEIIQHEQNGLLVENHKPEAMAQAMRRMFEDDTLYERCKNNAVASVQHLAAEEVVKQWHNVLL